MIALDANLLVRYFTGDDSSQAEKAAWLIETDLTPEEPGFISLVTLCEAIWVLEDVYHFDRANVELAITALLDASQIEVEQNELVETALNSVHRDIADVIVHLVGQAHGCSHTLTFDRKFARIEGVELLG
jgi:predicted nucleic-acid-binding protein